MSAVLLLGLVGAVLLVAATVAVLLLEVRDAGRAPNGAAKGPAAARHGRVPEAATLALVVVSVAYAVFRIAVLAG